MGAMRARSVQPRTIPRQSGAGYRMPRMALFAMIVLAALLGLGSDPTGGDPPTAYAGHTTAAVRVYSPVSGTWWVSSPPRLHNGCEPYTSDYVDSPWFDVVYPDGPCRSAVPVTADWAIDLNGGAAGDVVFIDIEPGTIDSNFGGGIYKVMAGDIGQWDNSANGQYQFFGVQVQTSTGVWENYAWIRLGHVNNFRFAPGALVAGPSSGRMTKIVANVAPKGLYEVHVHQDFYNYNYWSRSYNWDGPTTDDDLYLTGPCIRSGGSAYKCNTKVYGSDVIGYVGGNKPNYAQVDNPYFIEF